MIYGVEELVEKVSFIYSLKGLDGVQRWANFCKGSKGYYLSRIAKYIEGSSYTSDDKHSRSLSEELKKDVLEELI
ncbi:hypothetical protein HNV12_04360 [Methanococcoides sp. SA1]|nr:hypothetical protein [Methanococcoides sp. SA1]